MIKTTIKNLLAREIDTSGHKLYVIRDGATVFYVGRSQDVSNRLWQHLGKGSPPGSLSLTGEFLLLNRPHSGAYQVELFTPQEVFPDFLLPPPLDLAEEELIRRLSPCFNVTYNVKKGELPEGYKDPRTPDLESTVSDFIPF